MNTMYQHALMNYSYRIFIVLVVLFSQKIHSSEILSSYISNPIINQPTPANNHDLTFNETIQIYKKTRMKNGLPRWTAQNKYKTFINRPQAKPENLTILLHKPHLDISKVNKNNPFILK